MQPGCSRSLPMGIPQPGRYFPPPPRTFHRPPSRVRSSVIDAAEFTRGLDAQLTTRWRRTIGSCLRAATLQSSLVTMRPTIALDRLSRMPRARATVVAHHEVSMARTTAAGDADRGSSPTAVVALLPRLASSRTGFAGSRGCGRPMDPAMPSVGRYRHRFGPGERPCRSMRPTCSRRPPVANADSLAIADGSSRSAVQRTARAQPSRTSPAPSESARQSRQFEISPGFINPAQATRPAHSWHWTSSSALSSIFGSSISGTMTTFDPSHDEHAISTSVK
jgi:hypothetical protein